MPCLELTTSYLTLSWIQNLSWGLLGLLAAGLLIRALFEPTQLEITRLSLTGKQSRAHELNSTVQAGLRIALLSDLHAEWLRLKPDRIAQALATEEYDVLLFAGDLTGRHHRPDLAKPWLDALAGIAKARTIPCYAVPGNHDSPESLELLRQTGFTVLVNDCAIVLDRTGQDWLIVGLDILKKGRPDFSRALDRATEAGKDVSVDRRIVLAHNPDTVFLIPLDQAAFFLAGHFHGGQIYLPFHLEFFLLRREKIGRMGYHKGCFTINSLSGYISRGLGSVLFPLRLGSLPELSILVLSAPPAHSPENDQSRNFDREHLESS